ncbi:MAG: hypothetical protein JW829_17050 [Pirellulales bacterium]|nr:hypothetical protein [Pirellulales bacterium]
MQKHLRTLVAFIGTVLLWSFQGPFLKWGQRGMALADSDAILRPMTCVGLAIFVIGVLVPIVFLRVWGEAGHWSVAGMVWNMAAGVVAVIGVMGLLFAFYFGGWPIYVLPLVIGGVLIVNSFLSIFLAGIKQQINWIFGAGLVMLMLGAVLALISRPGVGHAEHEAIGGWLRFVWQILCIVLVIVCWGTLGPILERGLHGMHWSSFRSFLCMGLASSGIALILPQLLLLTLFAENSAYTIAGTSWSLLAGVAGSIGVFGLVLILRPVGKPVFVIPLVLGGTVIVDSLRSVVMAGGIRDAGTLWTTGLVLILAGSIMVFIFAPRTEPWEKVQPQQKVAAPPKKETSGNKTGQGFGDKTI